MQGGQGPGRGVYAVRRIVAVLVILLLLVLLVPRACQALFGPEEESSGPTAPETSVTEESTTGVTEETVEQGSTASGGETEVEVSIAETASGVGVGGEESIEALNMEAAANLTGMAPSFEAPLGGSVVGDTNLNRPAPPVPDISSQQQAVQPVTLEAPIPPEQPVLFEQPTFFGEPAFFGESPFFEGPMFLEEPVTFEEPTIASEEPKAKDTVTTPPRSGPVAIIDSH